MSEYTEIEQPFLEQLASLGWTSIDQGSDIPQNPSKSLRQTFANGYCQTYSAQQSQPSTPPQQVNPGSPPNNSKTCKIKFCVNPTAPC
jgi:hypothetical protein